MTRIQQILLLGIVLITAGCASPFPNPGNTGISGSGLTGSEILANCLDAHGGDLRNDFSEVRLSVSGTWGNAIKRIQPIVTDFEYRIDSIERYWISEGKSRIEWNGPAGQKVIMWDYPNVSVSYNGVESTNPDALGSSAMTSSTFALFHLGPSVLAWRGGEPARLSDEFIDGRLYHRLYFVFEPGFGFSDRDQVVAYIDVETMRLYRVWLTIEGFRTTKGATVDVTFLDYKEVSGYLLPSRFDERVRAPISIHAHAWHNTRMELVKPTM